MLKKDRSAKAAVNEEPGGTNRTSCGPFAFAMLLANGKTPSVTPFFGPALPKVKGLNDTRTSLADFFSILREVRRILARG
jgi:hypothetical protein